MDKRLIIVDSNLTLPLHRTSAGPCSHLYGTCIFLLVLIFVVACAREVPVVPQHLIGEWKTSAPGYADRYMKFTKDTLTYGIGDGEEISHWIYKIGSEQSGQRIVYTFYYREAEGDKTILSFTYMPDAGGTIQLKNDNKIWEKAAL
jgi:hypothetical protein